MTKRRLFLVQVAINNYAIKPLAGCLNDQKNFHDYIFAAYGNNEKYELLEPHILTEENATRSNIIKSFDFYDDAKDGDICIFFFAGHGVQVKCPEMFLHLEPDEALEAIVPYDMEEKGPVLDKELSHLIWKATKDKEINFLTVMDCCHSGGITRVDEEFMSDIKVRKINPVELDLKEKDIHGIEDFVDQGNGLKAPRNGDHVTLSAAQGKQTAKEVVYDRESRGAFTHSLVSTFQESGKNLTYQQLMNVLNIRVGKLVDDQTPHMLAFPSEKSNTFFITGEPYEGQDIYDVYRESGTQDWYVKAGGTSGIRVGEDEDDPTLFHLNQNPDQELKVVEVEPGRSKVTGMEGMDNGIYQATLKRLAVKKIKLAFTPESNQENKDILTQTFQSATRVNMELVPFEEGRDFLIHTNEKEFWLTKPFGEQALFRRVQKQEDPQGKAFLGMLEKVAKWNQVLLLANPASHLNETYFKIDIFKLTAPNQYNEDAPDINIKELEKDPKKSEFKSALWLPFMHYDGQWYAPAFKMRIKNISQKNLWFSTLFMESNFGISNELMPGVELEAGQEAWLEYRFDNTLTRIIQVWVEDEYHKLGTVTLHDYLKIFVSTQDPKTYDLQQKGLPHDRIRIERAFGRKVQMGESWQTVTIPLSIHRPLELKSLSDGRAKSQLNISIKAPEAFKSKFHLNQYEPEIKALKDRPLIDTGEEYTYDPLVFRPALYDADGLSVITLYDVNDAALITKTTPLTIEFNPKEGYVPKAGVHFPIAIKHDGTIQELPHLISGEQLELYALPEPSPAAYEGLGESIKIFIQKKR